MTSPKYFSCVADAGKEAVGEPNKVDIDKNGVSVTGPKGFVATGNNGVSSAMVVDTGQNGSIGMAQYDPQHPGETQVAVIGSLIRTPGLEAVDLLKEYKANIAKHGCAP